MRVFRLEPYDAVLLVSFGGPEDPEQVMPFLHRVTAGRGIGTERLAEVAEHYHHFGGRSPINDQCRRLLADLRAEFDRRGIATPLAWGNRNAEPLLTDVLPALAEAGHRRVLTVRTSAYPAYSSCRQYTDNIDGAAEGTGVRADRIRQYATHPAYAAAWADRTVDAVGRLGERCATAPRLVYVTHSIPTAMADGSGPCGGAYPQWHARVADEITRQVAERVAVAPSYDLVYCSRSGSPHTPWLEPDVNSHLASLAAAGTEAVVFVPIGFISDHMEVVYDLDVEAAATADRLGLAHERALEVSTHPGFVAMLVDLMVERAALARGEQIDQPTLPGAETGLVVCPEHCCPAGVATGGADRE